MLSVATRRLPLHVYNAAPSTSVHCRTLLPPPYNSDTRIRSLRLTTPQGAIPRGLSARRLVEAAPKAAQPYLRLMRADKPIGTWLLYLPCTWSIALATPAGHLPSLYMLALFGTGAFFMRSAGCVINDLWDRDFDRKVERTKLRPLASGKVSERHAIALLAGLLSVSLGVLLQLNWLSVFVGASSMALVLTYPLAKRFTYWPQLMLGCTFNWGAILGYTAVTNELALTTDKADDVLIGVKSTALRFGERTKRWLSGFATTMIGGLTAAGVSSDQACPYYVAVAATACHLAWQIGTVNINDGADCWKKFRSNQWLGALLFAGIVIGNLLKSSCSS
ncbi:COQ-2 protein [Aphelenchoides avenae]|nr:COQ-2 protein [Aphelenchus avenae]